MSCHSPANWVEKPELSAFSTIIPSSITLFILLAGAKLVTHFFLILPFTYPKILLPSSHSRFFVTSFLVFTVDTISSASNIHHVVSSCILLICSFRIMVNKYGLNSQGRSGVDHKMWNSSISSQIIFFFLIVLLYISFISIYRIHMNPCFGIQITNCLSPQKKKKLWYESFILNIIRGLFSTPSYAFYRWKCIMWRSFFIIP